MMGTLMADHPDLDDPTPPAPVAAGQREPLGRGHSIPVSVLLAATGLAASALSWLLRG